MIGKVKTIIQFKVQTRLIIIDVNGVVGKTYVVDGNRNSKRWEKIQVGDTLTGLEWFDEEGKIIDADSKINVIK